MRGVYVFIIATLMTLVACTHHISDKLFMEWGARDYKTVVATFENGGLRAIEVADSVMGTKKYDLNLYAKRILMDTTTFRVDYELKDSSWTGGEVTVHIARANFIVMQVIQYQ